VPDTGLIMAETTWIADVELRFRLRLADGGYRRANRSAFEAGKPPLRANAQGW
jgi:hypothetical protein